METWYILEDGTPADPRHVAPGADGALRHQSGIAVAVGPHGPRSRCMSAEDIAKATAAPDPALAAGNRMMSGKPERKPVQSPAYKTRKP